MAETKYNVEENKRIWEKVYRTTSVPALYLYSSEYDMLKPKFQCHKHHKPELNFFKIP